MRFGAARARGDSSPPGIDSVATQQAGHAGEILAHPFEFARAALHALVLEAVPLVEDHRPPIRYEDLELDSGNALAFALGQRGFQ